MEQNINELTNEQIRKLEMLKEMHHLLKYDESLILCESFIKETNIEFASLDPSKPSYKIHCAQLNYFLRRLLYYKGLAFMYLNQYDKLIESLILSFNLTDDENEKHALDEKIVWYKKLNSGIMF